MTTSTDTGPVLRAIAESAAKICDALDALIFLEEGGDLVIRAHFGPIPLVVDRLPIGRDWVAGRAYLDRQPVHVHDVRAKADDYPVGHAMAVRQDHRTVLAVPLLRERGAIGAIGIRRQTVQPFTEKQIGILESFAAQAAMAIENARLLAEVEARNRELTESLEQQSATSSILRAIANSPTDVQPVLDAVAESAAKLLGAYDAGIVLRDGDLSSVKAHYGPLPILKRDSWPASDRSVNGRAMIDRKPIHVHDLWQAEGEFPASYALAKEVGHRTMLAAPMLVEHEAIGAIFLRRLEVQPFTDKQIDLLTTFADQAAIAIHNVKLFDEEQARNRELTATGEVLRAIAASPTDIQPVLDAVAESAARLCGAYDCLIYLSDGETTSLKAHHGSIPINYQHLKFTRDWVSGRAFLERKPVHVHDAFQAGDEFPKSRELALQEGQRTILSVPLLREDEAIGTISIRRTEVRPFSQKQIDLLTTFADQAVIAIENVRLFEEVQTRTSELSEALQYQTATGEVLETISRSAFDLDSVLSTLVKSSLDLCHASGGNIHLWDGAVFRVAQQIGWPETFKAYLRENPIRPGMGTVGGRAALTKAIAHVPDVLEDPDYTMLEGQRIAGYRSLLGVPLIRDDEVIGLFSLGRNQPEPFTPREIELVQTFADQAVMAIHNVRLFDEVQARNNELHVALDHQTATSDLLKVVGQSTFDLQPVFDALAESAVRLCEAERSIVLRFDGEFLRAEAWHGMSPELIAFVTANPMPLGRQSISARAGLQRKTVHVRDVQTDPEYTYALQDRDPIRTVLGVPMLRGEELLGVTVVYRLEMRPFATGQIALMETFADQAVIAIENARLFEEVQARTRELQESLEHQTATSDVLNVISRSPSQIAPVFGAIVETAGRLCEANLACVFTLKDGLFHLAANSNADPALIQYLKSNPIALDRSSLIGRAALERRTIHLRDCLADPEYTLRDLQRVGKYRSMIGVPLLRDGEPIGAIGLMRFEVRPFTDKQIDLVTTFADQAVIAIENTRLFEEVQARTAELARSVGELEALGQVSQAVNSTLDLEKVLETIVAKAVQLSETDAGSIYVYSKSADRFRLKANYGMSPELIAAVTSQAININDPGLGDAARTRAPVQVPDLAEIATSPAQRVVLKAGFRSLLYVPLLRQRKVVGGLVVRRRSPGIFSDATVKLMETFAAQSVLAIQNARLFSEVEEKGHEIEIASRHKSQFLANMSHELRTPLNSVLGFAEMLADGLYGDLPEKARATLGRIQSNGKHLLGLINDVLDLSKIEAGQLVLTMEDYSIDHIVKSIASTAEPLAQAKGVKLTTTVAQGLPLGRGDERRIAQVLLNLAGNAVKFTDHGSIEITAAARDGKFEVSVRDTGPGIAPENQARIFEEFQQIEDRSTRAKGGTGLGLAISKRIVEMHGGEIGVTSTVGAGSTFRFVIPVRAVETARAA